MQAVQGSVLEKRHFPRINHPAVGVLGAGRGRAVSPQLFQLDKIFHFEPIANITLGAIYTRRSSRCSTAARKDGRCGERNTRGDVEPKLKELGVIFGLLLSLTVASACLQTTGTTYDGRPNMGDGRDAATSLQIYLRMDRHEDGAKMVARLANSTNFNDRCDYAVALVYLGKSREAVDLLRTLEQEQPGKYAVAANLGTALELQGRCAGSGKESTAIRSRTKGRSGCMQKSSKQKSHRRKTPTTSRVTRCLRLIRRTRPGK